MRPVGQNDRITVLNLIGSLRIGGAEQQVVSLAPLFDRERFRIIVCAMQPGGGLRDRLDQAGVEYACLNYRVRSCIPAMLRFISLLRREKVDILHTHMYTASKFGRIAGVLAGVPVMIATDHGHDPWKRWWHVAFDRVLLKHTDLRIGVSQDVADAIRACENPPPEKLAMIPNGVDPERFKPDEAERNAVRAGLGIADDEVLVGAVGRLVEPKALHILIEAVSQLAQTMSQVRLVLVGDGPLRSELEKQAADLGISDRVLFAGMRMDIPAVLSAIDVYVMSSKSEGLPVSLLEAMSAEKPVVATKVGGIPEAVTDRREALLVQPNDPSALADAINEVISDPELAAQLGRRARERVTSAYSVAATARALEQVYRDLLEKTQTRAA
jgi:glycosyltransferase involved in cell wall biosynthesis